MGTQLQDPDGGGAAVFMMLSKIIFSITCLSRAPIEIYSFQDIILNFIASFVEIKGIPSQHSALLA